MKKLSLLKIWSFADRDVYLKFSIIMNSSDKLYLAGYLNVEKDEISLSVESFIISFVYKYCDLKLDVCFVNVEDMQYIYNIPTSVFKFSKFLSNETNNYIEELYCLLPAVVTEQGKFVVAGLCAVLRWAIKNHLLFYPDHHCINLLGFRGGCLVACTESSIWTKFCELQLPGSVQEVSKLRTDCSLKEIPKNLVLLDEHLKRPVRTHNILKRKLDIAKQVKQSNGQNEAPFLPKSANSFILYDENSAPFDENEIHHRLQTMVITEKSEDFALDHCYLEGIDFTLADMIVFPCVYYLLNELPSQTLVQLKHVTKWYERMWSNHLIEKTAEMCGMKLKYPDKNCLNSENTEVTMPQVEQNSLYKRDPSYTKLKCKYRSPDKIIALLQSANIYPKYVSKYCSTLDWKSLPSMLHPANGDLPQKRLDRKCQQVESIVTAVLKIAEKNDTIVEFCSGGGHVGLLLAYFLPHCKIILIENKESSMMRAKCRTENLKLTNVHFYQCNLDYFKGKFDVGVCLHACGVATDLVLQQCIQQKASFVCCPCCYGSVQDNHLLSYPLSKKFQDTNITKKDYMLLAHFADRTEVNTPTAEQGEVCMGFIDTDRLLFAMDQGYKGELTTLQPETCSPKHNLLIGISPLKTKT